MTEHPQTSAQRPPARLGGILKLGAALAVLAIAGALLLLDPLTEVNAGEELASHFELNALPFGFRVEGAHRLMTQEVVVALGADDPRVATTPELDVTSEPVGDTDAEAEAEAKADADSEADAASHDADDELPAAEAEDRERHAQDDGTPPSRLFLVRYPRREAQSVLEQQMRRHTESLDQPHGGEQDDDSREQLLTIDGGRLPWGEFDADFVLERKYTSDGHFEDVLRVNLTREQQCWVLFALWPRDYRGSREPVEALLEALRPV